jgi:hypothetical protein
MSTSLEIERTEFNSSNDKLSWLCNYANCQSEQSLLKFMDGLKDPSKLQVLPNSFLLFIQEVQETIVKEIDEGNLPFNVIFFILGHCFFNQALLEFTQYCILQDEKMRLCANEYLLKSHENFQKGEIKNSIESKIIALEESLNGN